MCYDFISQFDRETLLECSMAGWLLFYFPRYAWGRLSDGGEQKAGRAADRPRALQPRFEHISTNMEINGSTLTLLTLFRILRLLPENALFSSTPLLSISCKHAPTTSYLKPAPPPLTTRSTFGTTLVKRRNSGGTPPGPTGLGRR
jgi:hypothetical protein